jgi:hypothetical protein
MDGRTVFVVGLSHSSSPTRMKMKDRMPVVRRIEDGSCAQARRKSMS